MIFCSNRISLFLNFIGIIKPTEEEEEEFICFYLTSLSNNTHIHFIQNTNITITANMVIMRIIKQYNLGSGDSSKTVLVAIEEPYLSGNLTYRIISSSTTNSSRKQNHKINKTKQNNMKMHVRSLHGYCISRHCFKYKYWIKFIGVFYS